MLGRNYNFVISMSKARNYGWTSHLFVYQQGVNILLTHGLCRYIDSWDALSECFDELEQEKILPSTE